MIIENINKLDNLYIIKVYGKDGETLIKLGYSSNIVQRLNLYYSHNPLFELLGTYYREDAKEFEKSFHNLKKSLVMDEWYSETDFEEMVNLILTYKLNEETIVTTKSCSKIEQFLAEKRVNFTYLCEHYFDFSDIEKEELDKRLPIIKTAYDVLGFEKLKALKFRKNEIEKELILLDNVRSNYWKISNLLGLHVGQWVELSVLKAKIQQIYDNLGILKIAKATDVVDYYEVEEKAKRVDNVKIKGYIIIRNKFKK